MRRREEVTRLAADRQAVALGAREERKRRKSSGRAWLACRSASVEGSLERRDLQRRTLWLAWWTPQVKP